MNVLLSPVFTLKLFPLRRSWSRDPGVEREVQDGPRMDPFLTYFRRLHWEESTGFLHIQAETVWWCNIISCLVYKSPFEGIMSPVYPNRRKRINVWTHMLGPWLTCTNGFLAATHENGDPDTQSQITSTTPRKWKERKYTFQCLQ